MEGLGTLLHLLPSRLNDAVVGVAWVDERTLFFKVTGCWLHNDTGSIDLVFKPQGGEATLSMSMELYKDDLYTHTHHTHDT